MMVPDRRQSALLAAELQALVGLTLAGPAHGQAFADVVRGEILRIGSLAVR